MGFGGSHALEKYVNEVAADVNDPQTGVSVLERRYARTLASADVSSKSKLYGNRYMKIGALGAGSDYSPFFQHLGIPSGNVGYGGEGSGGEYHSIYDSYDHFIRFKDPGLLYGVTLAKTAGRMLLRMANADVLPFDYSILTHTVNGYFSEIKSLIEQSRNQVDIENKLIADRVYQLAADPKENLKHPSAKPVVPFIDFSPVENALAQVKKTTDQLSISLRKADLLDVASLKKLNQLLYQAEQKLLDEKGLPRRPWYRHQIYAPGYYTGYGVKTLPGLREGIEESSWAETKERIDVLSKLLLKFDGTLQEAISIFSK